MEEIYNCLIHKHALAFAIGTVTLLLTIILVSRHIIGFVLSLFLLLVGLGATYSVEHQDLVKSYFYKFFNQLSPKQESRDTRSPRTDSTRPTDQNIKPPEEQIEPSQQQSKPLSPDTNLRGQSERQKARVQRFINTHSPEP